MIKQLLLMKAPFVEVAAEEGFIQAKRSSSFSIFDNLCRFKRAVGVMSIKPVAYSFAKRIVVKIAG